MTSPTIVYYLMLLFLGYIAQMVALESSSSVYHKRPETGENLTLPCAVTDDGSQWFHWYKQTLGENLSPICSFKKYTTYHRFFGDFQNNDRFLLDTENGKKVLKISDLQMPDSATYLCLGTESPILQTLATITVSVKDGNRTKLDSGDEVSSGVLVYSLSGALISALILIVVLLFLLYKMNKRILFLSQEIQATCSAPSTTNMEGNRGSEDVCYAALNVNMPNTSRRQRNTVRDECVYSSVRQ